MVKLKLVNQCGVKLGEQVNKKQMNVKGAGRGYGSGGN